VQYLRFMANISNSLRARVFEDLYSIEAITPHSDSFSQVMVALLMIHEYYHHDRVHCPVSLLPRYDRVVRNRFMLSDMSQQRMLQRTEVDVRTTPFEDGVVQVDIMPRDDPAYSDSRDGRVDSAPNVVYSFIMVKREPFRSLLRDPERLRDLVARFFIFAKTMSLAAMMDTNEAVTLSLFREEVQDRHIRVLVSAKVIVTRQEDFTWCEIPHRPDVGFAEALTFMRAAAGPGPVSGALSDTVTIVVRVCVCGCVSHSFASVSSVARVRVQL
jgi:hypothetical protein